MGSVITSFCSTQFYGNSTVEKINCILMQMKTRNMLPLRRRLPQAMIQRASQRHCKKCYKRGEDVQRELSRINLRSCSTAFQYSCSALVWHRNIKHQLTENWAPSKTACPTMSGSISMYARSNGVYSIIYI